jgi:3-oxoadipate enol-lactonase
VPVDRDEHPVAWREDGPSTGELVVLLHGLGGSRIAWDPQLALLAAAGLRAAAWDMPGYGASASPAAWTFAALADAAAAWIGRLGGPAHVVGLSFGGMIAQHLVLRDRTLVRSLVLCDTSPAFGLDGTTTAEEWVTARLDGLQRAGSPAAAASDVLRSVMAPDAHGLDLATAAMARISTGGLTGAIHCLPTHDVRHRLHEIDVPTLVLVGEHDRETPRAYSEHLADGIPGARLETIDGAGHISNLERPAAFDRALLGFLLTPPRGP